MSQVNNATALQFAEMVQAGLRIGVELAGKAIQEGNAEFFEDAIADQLEMRERAIYNHTNRVDFDTWLNGANELNAVLRLHKYDTAGELKRMNDTIFQACAREYYDQFVKSIYDRPLDTILAQLEVQLDSLRGMVKLLNEGVSDDDRAFLGELTDAINEKIETATVEELNAVLKS